MTRAKILGRDFLLSWSAYASLSYGGQDGGDFKRIATDDLDAAQGYGFTATEGPWINVPWLGGPEYRVFDEHGDLNGRALDRFLWLAEEHRERGMVMCPRVSVVEDDGTEAAIKLGLRGVFARVPNTLSQTLFLDAGNEWNGKRRADEMARIMREPRREAPWLQVGASTSGPWEAQKRAQYELALAGAPMAAVLVHTDRSRHWVSRTAEQSQEAVRLARRTPIYWNEVHRLGYGQEGHPHPSAQERFDATRAAYEAGCAGFCGWHSVIFDVKTRGIFAQAQSEDRRYLQMIRDAQA